MALEISLGDKTVEVELLKKENNKVSVSIDNKIYDVDIVMVENGVYSIIIENKSFNVELIRGENSKKYTVNTMYNTLDIEIIDAESKYIKNRGKADIGDDTDRIFSPMPGKIVKIPVKRGDVVKEGETAIIVEAMKMQSEYKVKKDKIVKEILVKEGDTVEGNQILITFEEPNNN